MPSTVRPISGASISRPATSCSRFLQLRTAFGLALALTLAIQAVALRSVRAGAGPAVELESV